MQINRTLPLIKFCYEKRAGAGEDADPLQFVFGDIPSGAVAVFDGLGGAGSGLIEREDGVIETGARRASRLGRECFENFIVALTKNYSGHNQNIGIERYNLIDYVISMTNSENLARCFDAEFRSEFSSLPASISSKIRSRMIRALPTTFAGAIYKCEPNYIFVRALWSGDSRVYYLAASGLYILTADHVREGNSAEPEGGGDAPLTNYLSEITPNKVDQYDFEFTEPGFLICATDGTYGYFGSDAHFEVALLQAMMTGRLDESETEKLRASVIEVAQDDASAVVVPLGFGWSHEQDALAERLIEIRFSEVRRAVASIDQIGLRLKDLELTRHELQQKRALSLTRARAKFPSRSQRDIRGWNWKIS